MDEAGHIDVIGQRIKELFGLHFVPSQWGNLRRNLMNFAHALHINDQLEDVRQWISQDNIPEKELQELARHLTVRESYFFREKAGMHLLSEKFIHSATASKSLDSKKLRLWSAGCSTGEEPYTIAMVLKEHIHDIEQWDINILATDLNLQSLDKARAGVYTPWSFRETPDYIKRKYFKPIGKNLAIRSAVKQMVHFTHLNLATDVFPSRINNTHNVDMIFCRNVLMYMSPEIIKQVAQNFYNCLNIHGWLVTSQVELNNDYFGAFQQVMYERGFFYKKGEKDKKPAESGKAEASTYIPSKAEQRTHSRTKPVRPRRNSENNPNSSPVSYRSDLLVNHQNMVDSALKKAANYYKNARYSECVSLCDRWIKKFGFESNLAHLLVQSYANLGRLAEAEALMVKLLEMVSGRAEYFYLYATILAEQKKLEKADQNLVKALYLEPGLLSARLSRSQILIQMGYMERAEKELNNLLNFIDDFDEQDPIASLDGLTAGRIRQMAETMKRNIE